MAAVISLAALGAAAHQVRSARAQVAEAQALTVLQRQVHRDATQPYVWVDVRPDDGQGHLIKVVLHNEGPTVATDIRASFTPPLPDTSNHTGATFTLLDSGVSALAPRQSVHWTLGAGPKMLKGRALQTFEVTVDALGPFGPTEQLRYAINFADWANVLAVQPGTLHEVRRATGI